ncbi:MAG: hypothetical protein JXD18_05775 [Anaerolineae bacterium]|nr:hypothetical protein [Anaerolineae bacterium]
MAQISRLAFFRHLRAEPNQYILHYRGGKVVRSGAGVAYWFHPLSAATAQVPVEDIESTFVLRERSADFQQVTVQVTLTYRITDPQKAAQRINFSLSLDTGAWLEQPLQRVESLWARWAQHPVRACLVALPLVEVVRAGADRTRAALEAALKDNTEIAGMGLALVGVQVDQVAPTAELERALQTPTREEIQQKADEATFQRRALAVEKERAIKENELATEIELARRQEELIQQEGDNRMLGARQEAEREAFAVQSAAEREVIAAEGTARQLRIRAEAEAERGIITAESTARQIRIRAEADVEARRIALQVETDAEARRVDMWRDAPPSVALGLAAQRFADKVERIEHLNLTPDLLGQTVQRLLLDSSAPQAQ